MTVRDIIKQGGYGTGNGYLGGIVFAFPKEIWQFDRDCEKPMFGWTDEQLDEALKGNGFLGYKYSCPCYVSKTVYAKNSQ